MKAVLLNDFKLVKKMALPFAIFIGVILALSVVITREISNKFFCSMGIYFGIYY